MIPEDLKYTESHEWVRWVENTAVIGITHYAQEQLSDVVYVELPEIGRSVNQGDECIVIESCKIAAEVYSPVSGKVIAVNKELDEHPDYINQEPYGKGWLIQIEMADSSEMASLLTPKKYRAHLEEKSL